MDCIDKISQIYEGNILLRPPCQENPEMKLPKEIAAILRVSDGIEETMLHPETGERISISWIIYPYEMMAEETAFYREEYGLDGIVFSDNGAGKPYLLKPDGTVVCFDPACGEEKREADSLIAFYR